MEKTIIRSVEEGSRKPLVIRIAVIILLLLAAAVVSYAQLHKPGKKTTIEQTNKPQKTIEATGTDLVLDLKNTAGDVLGTVTKKTQKKIETVVEDAKNTVVETASNSASTVQDYVWDNTAGVIIKQLEKLPQEEQDKIKQEICN